MTPLQLKMAAKNFALMLFLMAFTISAVSGAGIDIKNAADCSCGFYDHTNENWFTDSTIVYFNESSEFPVESFIKEEYTNYYEKGWNTQYRQGTSPDNVQLVTDQSNQTSLELTNHPTNPLHLVMGGEIRTLRQDIFFGSFRFFMKPSSSLGTSMTAESFWNNTQAWSVNAQTTNEFKLAWVSLLHADEFPERRFGANFTTLSNSTFNVDPFAFNEYRVDWTREVLNFSIADSQFRNVRARGDQYRFPETPAPITLKHWSVGNYYSMQGPPAEVATAHVGYVRMFFNSSLYDDKMRAAFVSRCNIQDACDVDDTGLRGQTPFDQAATTEWVQIQPPRDNKTVPTIIIIFCGSLSFVLVINAIVGRVLSRGTEVHGTGAKSKPQLSTTESLTTGGPLSGTDSPATLSTPPSSATAKDELTYLGAYPNIAYFDPSSSESCSSSTADSIHEEKKNARLPWREFCDGQTGLSANYLASIKIGKDGKLRTDPQARSVQITENAVLPSSNEHKCTVFESRSQGRGIAQIVNGVAVQSATNYTANTSNPGPKKRVDYLAGLVAFSCLLVTAIHFVLTFVCAAINPDAYVHYPSEIWARRTIGPYFLNLIWIGPFLMTSSRFLVASYLKNGKLSAVAERTVGRPFRLLVPVAAVAMLEYFLVDAGACDWLQYLPSVTWSTWPFMTVPTNFGYFLSEILQLAYLIPNAAPQITFNYCTGVLWTIPVQLQGTWQTLLGVIMIYEIKTPYKRFGFYAFCISVNWYALSWGTYFYLGILFTDLDLTYNWRKYLHARPLVYYPFIAFLSLLCLGGLSLDTVTQWTVVNYATYEYAIHPDITTGMALKDINNGDGPGYPQYYVPKFHGLIFSLGIQGVLELSPLVQKLLSFKLFMYIFPHIFTIYLIHGFIFWSVGSVICVKLSIAGVPYWANVFTVAVVSYTVLFMSLPFLTPIVETLGKNVTTNIWRFANEPAAPRRNSLYPFPPNFLSVRTDHVEEEHLDEITDESKILHKTSASQTKPNSTLIRGIASIVAMINPKFSHLTQKHPDGDSNPIPQNLIPGNAHIDPEAIKEMSSRPQSMIAMTQYGGAVIDKGPGGSERLNRYSGMFSSDKRRSRFLEDIYVDDGPRQHRPRGGNWQRHDGTSIENDESAIHGGRFDNEIQNRSQIRNPFVSPEDPDDEITAMESNESHRYDNRRNGMVDNIGIAVSTNDVKLEGQRRRYG